MNKKIFFKNKNSNLNREQKVCLLIPQLGKVVQEAEQLREVLEMRLGRAGVEEVQEHPDEPGDKICKDDNNANKYKDDKT